MREAAEVARPVLVIGASPVVQGRIEPRCRAAQHAALPELDPCHTLPRTLPVLHLTCRGYPTAVELETPGAPLPPPMAATDGRHRRTPPAAATDEPAAGAEAACPATAAAVS